MTIFIKSPSLAINSDDVPGPNYHMSQTWNPPKGITTTDVVNRIIQAGRDRGDDITSDSGYKWLASVVINCHGAPGKLYVGGLDLSAITIADLDGFSKIYDNEHISIGTLWLVACNAAREAKGKEFCGALARKAKCNVVAADVSQYVEPSWVYLNTDKHGQIDDYEGTVYLFDWSDGSSKVYQPPTETNVNFIKTQLPMGL